MPSFAPVYLFVLLAAHGARANFLTECEFLSFSRGEGERNPFIHYSCPTKQAPFLWCSRLELNDCFANDYGDLIARQKGGFGGSCGACNYDEREGILACWCHDGTGSIRFNSISIVDTIWLSGAKLGCFGMKSGSTCSTAGSTAGSSQRRADERAAAIFAA